MCPIRTDHDSSRSRIEGVGTRRAHLVGSLLLVGLSAGVVLGLLGLVGHGVTGSLEAVRILISTR